MTNMYQAGNDGQRSSRELTLLLEAGEDVAGVGFGDGDGGDGVVFEVEFVAVFFFAEDFDFVEVDDVFAVAADEAAAAEALFDGFEAAADHVFFHGAGAVGVPDDDVVVVGFDVVEVGEADGEAHDAAVVEEGYFLEVFVGVDRFVGDDVAGVHQADGFVHVDDGQVHAGDDVWDDQGDEGVDQGVEEEGQGRVVFQGDDPEGFGPQGDERVEQADEEHFGQVPEDVLRPGHLPEAAGGVHDAFAQDDQQEGGEVEGYCQAEGAGRAEGEPDVVGEGDAEQHEEHGKEGREGHGRRELIFSPEVIGNDVTLHALGCPIFAKIKTFSGKGKRDSDASDFLFSE